MRTPFARGALALALVATLLRGLLPAGWMPNPQGAAASPFVICTMDGPRRLHAPVAPHRGQHDDQDRANAPCHFAAAAHLARPAEAPVLLAPSVVAFGAPESTAASFDAARRARAHPARAPPVPA